MKDHAFKPLLLALLRQTQVNLNAFFQQLPPAELEAMGTPDCWAAKDHAAHMTFWRRYLALRLQASLRQEPQPESENFEHLNSLLFEQYRYHAWPELLSESDQVYAELLALVAQLTEEDLLASERFDWVKLDGPLYLTFIGHCHEHTLAHLVQYLLERNMADRAREVYESWVNQVIGTAEVPTTLKGFVFYNQACYYATHNRLEQAGPILQQAFACYPDIRKFARTDPDLVALSSLF